VQHEQKQQRRKEREGKLLGYGDIILAEVTEPEHRAGRETRKHGRRAGRAAEGHRGSIARLAEGKGRLG